ncbi:MAG: MBG domain-containing protein, partial [Anaeroplasmataceae bacterium]|nr:MBG domain-containing protein [Anaeroplasmataceae bacterium]
MQKKKLWIIIGSVLLVLIVLAIVLPITLLSSNKKLKLNLTFESQTIIYDGKLHSLEVEGEIPSTIEISYENNEHKDVGTYEVIAHIKDTKTSYPDMKATLTILPFSSQNVELKDVTIPYDGNTHGIYVLGNIPEDVSVTYDNNDQVNVGSYEVTAHFNYTGNNCENLVDLKATLTIERVQLDLSTILFESQSFIYDGTDKFLEAKGFPDGVLVTYENNKHKDVGTYEVTATFSDPLGNYIITGSKTATLTIEKATYDMSLVHFTSIEIPYDGLEHELLIDGTLPDGVSVLRYIDNKRTELGQTICTVEFSYDEKNYNPIPAMTATLTIVQGTMDFLQQTEFYTVYNGSPQSIDIGNLPEGITVTYENNSHTVAGSYQVTAHFKDVNERYKDKTMILTLIIQKANYDLSNVVFEDEIFIYDGNSHSLSIKGELPQGVEVTYSENTLTEIGRLEVIASFTIPDPLNYNPIPGKVAYLIIVPEKLDSVYLEDETFSYDGEYHGLTLHGELPLGVTYEFINNSQKEVGTYEVSVHFNVKEYGELKATLTITKADIDMSKVFFHGATFVYDGKEHTLTIDGELPKMVNVSYLNNSRIDIGRQTATAIFEVLEPEHYNEIPNLYAELVIVDNHLTGISFQDSTVVYDRLEHSIFIEGELPYGVTVSYTNNGQKNAGTYQVTAHFHDSTGQYQDLEDMTAKLTILKANFAKNGIIFVSRTFTYDGTTKRLEIYCDDIPEDIIVKYENNDHIHAGIYTVTVSFIDAGENYNPVQPIEATLTIKRAIVNLDHIVFKNEEYEYDGFEHTLTIHGTLPAGVRVVYTPNSLTKLGRILVTARFIVDEKNYEPIPSRTAYLTITKGALENITLKDKTVVYDGNVHSLVIEGNLPSGVNVEYQNNDQTNAGVYEVIADFYDAEGYYNSLTAYLTISKAVYDMSDISFQSASYVYDGVPHTLVITGTLPEGVTVIYSANTLTNAGTLQVTARFIGNPNYEDIPSMQATLTIEKIVITGITFEGATFTYDGTPHSIYVAGVEGYPIRILYYNNEKINAGEHEVIASFVLLNDNYAPIDDMTALLTISPIPLKPVALEDQTFILDGTEHSLSITAELPEGVYAVYENNGQIYEGTYVVKMHLESQTPNYILPEPVTATLTIASDGSYHTVIFHISDTIEEVRIIKDNEGIEDIPIPEEISGYDGYFEGDFSHITSRMEFYPVYTESQFTIFFDSDSVESLSVKYLASYTLPIPTKQDYLFKRWVDEEGNEITDGTYLWTRSITLYSVWQCEVTIKNVNDYIYEEII